jgi:2-amino-4-hydroxy-6-hydroxymethyldihydropteridine diphosphokinase
MTKAAIGIGSNIGDPIKNVEEGMDRLTEVGKIIAKSSLYRTKPWGEVLDQPDFINAAAIIEVDCQPMQLLTQLLSIEKSMGRERRLRWGPRIIDLDILTFGNITVNEPNLTIPHRYLYERAFVLAPLSEIDSSYLEAFNSLPTASRNEVKLVKNIITPSICD